MGSKGGCAVTYRPDTFANSIPDLTWWVVQPLCLPMAIPSDLAAKWLNEGKLVFLGTYWQAYDVCQGRRKRLSGPPPRRVLNGPPKRVRPVKAGVTA